VSIENCEKLSMLSLMSGSINRMSHVYRYSSVPTIRKENVAEHSWYVAYYSFVIGLDLVRRGCEIDFGKLLSRALVHDLDESMTGDFLRHVKYGHPRLKSVLDEVSIAMLESMEKELHIPIKEPWTNAKSREDLEGDIVAIADLARVLSYVYEEIQLGNNHVKYILKECCKYLRDTIKERRPTVANDYARDLIKWVEEVAND